MSNFTRDRLTLLDLCAIPRPSHWPRILNAFDLLAEGESVRLRGYDNPTTILMQLQDLHTEEFFWIPYQNNKEHWEAEIIKRPKNQPVRVCELLEADHRRLDGLIQATLAAEESGLEEIANRRFEAFLWGTRHHLRMEEEVLYPAVKAVGLPIHQIPGDNLQDQHTEIDTLLEQLANISLRSAALQTLRGVLRRHHHHEEYQLYPLCDELLADQATLHQERMSSLP
jgi:uncharacterized protein (DUF2249 family)/hemerythrin-like domain-containing protein